MELNRTPNELDRNARNKENENWDKIEGNLEKTGNSVNDFIGTVTNEVVNELVDKAKLDWKEPVNNFNSLPTNAEVGETRMTKDNGNVYRYNGTDWEYIQQIDAGPVNELDSRLTSQLKQKANQQDVPSKYEYNDFRRATSASLEAVLSKLEGREPVDEQTIEDLTGELIDGTLNNSNGNYAPSEVLKVTASYLPVNPSAEYVFGAELFDEDKAAVVKFARYDANKAFISISDFISIYPDIPYEVPLVDGTSFVKISLSNYAAEDFFFNIGDTPYYRLPPGTIYEDGFWASIPTPPLKEKTVQPNHLADDTVNIINEWKKLSSVEYVRQLFNSYISGTLNNRNGNFAENGTTVVSDDFIRVQGSKIVVGLENAVDNDYLAKIAFYDASKNFISITDFIDVRGNTVLVLPADTHYVKAVVSLPQKDTFFLNEGEVPYFNAENKVLHSGFSELIPKKVVTKEHLSDGAIDFIRNESGGGESSNQQPFPKKLMWETVVEDDQIKVSHLSRDGKVIYATRVSRIMQSTNEGKSWEYVTGAPPIGNQALAVRDLDDGELLLTTKREEGQGVKSKIYKTRGYKRDDLSDITLVEVLEAKGVYADFNNSWGLDVHHNIVVASEYGQQGLSGARYAFLSTDFGNTWKEIFDQKTASETVVGAPAYTSDAHVHTIHYDRYDNIIWIAVGDQANSALYYSKDMGVTWEVVEGTTGRDAMQFTGIVSYPEAVFFGSDRSPDGIYFWDRVKNKKKIVIEPYHMTFRGDYRTLVYGFPFRRYAEKDEITYFAADRDVIVNGTMSGLIVGMKGVYGAETLFDFTKDYPDTVGATACVGDTAGGNILVSIKVGNSYKVLRAKAPIWE